MLSFHVPLHGAEKVTFLVAEDAKPQSTQLSPTLELSENLGKFKSPVTIPHICHFWDAIIFLGLQKVRKKIASRQNSVNF
jgi:hypothetical protein